MPAPTLPTPPHASTQQGTGGLGDEVVMLYPRRRRSALIFAGSTLFAVPLAWSLTESVSWIQILGVLICGGGGLVSAAQLHRGLAFARISPEGLTMRNVFQRRHWDWNDIEHFRVIEITTANTRITQIGFDRRDRTPGRQSPWQTLTRGMAGCDDALPETYGRDPQELVELLEAARARYARDQGPSRSLLADLALRTVAAAIPRNRVPAVTGLLALCCVVVFVLEAQRYGVAPTAAELESLGGASLASVRAGDWWCLLTANILHANPVHLVVNLIGLSLAGVLLEREIGWSRMALLCGSSAIVAGCLGVLLAPDAVGVGISGVVLAIAGYAVVRDRHRTRALGIVAWGIVPITLIGTFVLPDVGVGAHLGGLLVGLLLGRIYERDANRELMEQVESFAAQAERLR